MNKTLLAILLYISCNISFATVTFTNDVGFLPYGFEENFLSGAGVALEGSPGNVISNPAAHVFKRGEKDFSVSGLQFNFYEGDQDVESKDKIGIKPGFSALQTSRENSSYVLYLFTPIDMRLQSSQQEDAQSNTDFSVEFMTVHFGGSYARKITPSFSLGGTLEFARQGALMSSRFHSIIDVGGTNYVYTGSFDIREEVYHLNAYLGGFYLPTPVYSIGLLVKLPTEKIYSKGEYKSTSYFSYTDNTSSDSREYRPNIESAPEFALGQSLKVSSFARVLLDMIYTPPHSYESESEDGKWTSGEDAFFRIHTGIIFNLSNKFDFLFGMAHQQDRVSSSWHSTMSEYSSGVVYKAAQWELGGGGYLITLPNDVSKMYGVLFSSKYLH